MESIPLERAKEQLEELVTRANKGEDVRISDPKLGTVKLTPVATEAVAATRKRRKFGRLAGKLLVPQGILDPMTEDELKDWYGDNP